MTGRRFGAFISAAVAAGVLLLLAAGCDALPDGEPPEGNLVDNTPPPVATPLAVRNNLATQLIVFALQRGITRLDPGSDPESVAIAVEALRTAGFRLDPTSPLRLDLKRSADGGIDLAATDAGGAEVWRSQRP